MPIKRLNYFTGQFLKENDFKDEQAYHINALSNHNKYVHSFGIASGLEVSTDKTKKHIILKEGMAIDSSGRQIILEKDKKIDIPKESNSPFFLTISLRTTDIDPAPETEFSGNTRIIEEPLIGFDQKEPDKNSNNIFLAEIKFDLENKTIISIDQTNRKKIGLSGDIEVKSITFEEKGKDEWPSIRGMEGKTVGLDINSKHTSLKGDVHVVGTLVAGKISGALDINMVGINHIRDESISVSKIKSHKNIVTGKGEIPARGEITAAIEESNAHLFLVTSVIPTTKDGQIEWKWKTEFKDDQLSYKLMLRNLSDKTVKYDVKYFDISE